MKKYVSKALIASLILLSPAIVYADHHKTDDSEKNIPNLVGKWGGKNNTISDKKGYLTRDKNIEITEQKDRRFKGFFKYSQGTVKFFGVIYPDNISFTWVSHGSRGFNHGRILGKNKISACFIEAGIDATAGCTLLERK